MDSQTMVRGGNSTTLHAADSREGAHADQGENESTLPGIPILSIHVFQILIFQIYPQLIPKNLWMLAGF